MPVWYFLLILQEFKRGYVLSSIPPSSPLVNYLAFRFWSIFILKMIRDSIFFKPTGDESIYSNNWKAILTLFISLSIIYAHKLFLYSWSSSMTSFTVLGTTIPYFMLHLFLCKVRTLDIILLLFFSFLSTYGIH